MADEFDFTLGTDDDGNVIDTTQPPDDTDTTTTYPPPEGGADLTPEQEWAKGWGGLNADGSINWDKFSKDDPFKLGTVSGDSPAIDPSSIADLAKSLPARAWNAIKSAFTKKDANGNDVTDWKALAAAGGGIAGLASNLMNKNNPQPIVGYQGKIPTLTAVQQQVPGTYDPNRRPGSSGQRYFTDMKYAAPSDAAAAQTSAGEQATGLAGLNASNPAMQKRPVATAPTAAPASSVINRMAPTLEGLESLTSAKNVATPTDNWKIPKFYGGKPNELAVKGGEYGSKDSAPTDIMAAVKAANPSLDWSKYNPDKMTMDYDQFDAARDNYMRAANPTFNQNKESDMAKAANAVQNAQLGSINPTTPANQPVAQPAAPGKYDRPLGGQLDTPYEPKVTLPYIPSSGRSLDSILGGLFDPSKRTPNPNAQPITYEDNYASGGGITALKRGNYLSGSTDGMADKLPANIDGNQEARLSHGEFVIPADVVSHLGNGNSEAGADRLYSMMDKIRKARTGTKKQGKQINPDKFLPGGSVGYAKGGIASFAAGDLVTGTDPSNVIGKESNLSNWAGDYVTNMLGKGQALADQPYQGYSGPLTAGASAGQTAAFQGAAGLNVPTGQMGAFTPQTFTADQAQNYMNPYLSAALNPQMEEMRRQSQLNLQPNMAKVTQAGG